MSKKLKTLTVGENIYSVPIIDINDLDVENCSPCMIKDANGNKFSTYSASEQVFNSDGTNLREKVNTEQLLLGNSGARMYYDSELNAIRFTFISE